MKRLKLLLASLAFVFALGTPALVNAVVSAQSCDNANCIGNQADGLTPIVQCPTIDGEITNPNTDLCDLAVNKQVSVNGGAFVNADTAADAASAHIGDTVTWKITVTNNSPSLTPQGTVYVNDVLPSGVTYQSSTASSGEYITDSSNFFFNDWHLPLRNPDTSTTLPATLTITTKASSVGQFQNIATLAKYDGGQCDGGCTYADANPSNDSDDAWVNIQTAPQVLGESTTSTPQVLGLTNTGTSTTLQTIFAILLIGAAVALGAYGRLTNKKKHYRI